MTKTLYKLTDSDSYTRRGKSGETLWEPDVWHEAPGGALCSAGVLHAYEDARIAVLMNPIHASISDPILWRAEGEVCARDGQLKCGCTRLRVVERIELPAMTTEQRVEIAIRCALTCCKEPVWLAWAQRWLTGEDRTAEAAWSAAETAIATAARATATAAEAAIATAAWAAATAAWAAIARAAWALDLVAIIDEVLQ